MDKLRRELLVFAGSAHPELAKNIVKYLGSKLGNIKIDKFPDGEIFVQFMQNIRGGDAFLVQPICYPPNENLMELLIMIDAAKRASAGRITAVIPYYGYARQDRKDQPRVPITAKLVADLLTVAGTDRILTMDLHAHQIVGFYNIPVDHLYAGPILIPYLRKLIGENAVVVSPDSGSVKMAHRFSTELNAGLAVIAKRRTDAYCVESSHLVGDVEGRNCLIVDDMTSTAGTLIAASNLLKKAGAKRIYASVSHCLLTAEKIQNLGQSPIERLITTDTIPISYTSEKIVTLSIAPVFGEAIKRIHAGGSLSSLFRPTVIHKNNNRKNKH